MNVFLICSNNEVIIGKDGQKRSTIHSQGTPFGFAYVYNYSSGYARELLPLLPNSFLSMVDFGK